MPTLPEICRHGVCVCVPFPSLDIEYNFQLKAMCQIYSLNIEVLLKMELNKRCSKMFVSDQII